MRIGFLLLTAVVMGCSSSGTWRKVETPHFTLNTDLGSSDAREAAAAMEATRDALVSAAWPSFPFKDEPHAEVFVLANGLDFEGYFGRKTAGVSLHSSPPMFFLYGSSDRWELRRSAHQPSRSVLRHEMVHELASLVYGRRQPQWFSEGFAQFLEAVYYSEDGRSVVLGGVNVQAYMGYKSVRAVSLRDALDWDKGLFALSDREASGLYGTSWLFIHWLYNTHSEALGRYMDELGRGTDPRRAFEVALPGFDADAVNRELFEYQRHGHFVEMQMPLVETKVSAESLRDDVLDPEAVKQVRSVLAAASKAHTGKGHDCLSRGEGSEGESGGTLAVSRTDPNPTTRR